MEYNTNEEKGVDGVEFVSDRVGGDGKHIQSVCVLRREDEIMWESGGIRKGWRWGVEEKGT